MSPQVASWLHTESQVAASPPPAPGRGSAPPVSRSQSNSLPNSAHGEPYSPCSPGVTSTHATASAITAQHFHALMAHPLDAR